MSFPPAPWNVEPGHCCFVEPWTSILQSSRSLEFQVRGAKARLPISPWVDSRSCLQVWQHALFWAAGENRVRTSPSGHLVVTGFLQKTAAEPNRTERTNEHMGRWMCLSHSVQVQVHPHR